MSTVGPGVPPLSPTREEFQASPARATWCRSSPSWHRRHPVEGVQFHLESILTGQGKALLTNFLALTAVAAPA
jgi:anthranilate/para-aminobenzoate synthase component II